MRVFVALNLPERTKDNLERSSKQFADFAAAGNFVPKDNFHITLHFLGEVAPSDVVYIQRAMLEVSEMPAPKLSIQQFVTLRAGDIVCAKFRQNKDIINLHDELGDKLEKSGFTVEHRAYRPHVTIARKPRFTLPFSEVTKSVDVFNMPFDACEMILYESVLSKSGSSYSELYKVRLPKTV